MQILPAKELASFIKHYFVVENKPGSMKRFRFFSDGNNGIVFSRLMKWLPARAYDNAVYVIFSNPIGMHGDQLKNGCIRLLIRLEISLQNAVY